MLGIEITGDLRGALFEARISQRFRNDTDRNVEVVYSFPLPRGAVLLSVDATLGDRRLSGVVVEKKDAEPRYEKAISEGDAAVMLEKNYDGTYSINLGNLAAGETAEVRYRFAQALRFSQNSLRLTIPTVIAPKYGDPIRQGRLMPHQVPEYDMQAEYRFSLALRLHGGLGAARISSPSHPIGVDASQGPATVTLAREAFLDRDFVLCLDGIEHTSLCAAGMDAASEGGASLLLNFCPRLGADEKAKKPVCVKILVDCSGSMNGTSISEARDALREIVGDLDAGDRFSLSRFGSTCEHRSRQVWTVSDAAIRSAFKWCDRLQADMGGTELNAALESTFRIGCLREHGCDVLLVTDGETYDTSNTLESARRSGHRVFVVGIGSSPEANLLHSLAEETGGACDFLAPGEDARPAIKRMFARLRSPRVTDLRMEWPEGAEILWQSPLPSALFDGDSAHVAAQAQGPVSGEAALKGRVEGAGEWVTLAKAILSGEPESMAEGDAVARVAASMRYAETEERDPDKATEIALNYQLVTGRTNFLMIHVRDAGQKATEMPELANVPQMMPAGWGGFGGMAPAALCEFNENDVDYECGFDVAPRLRSSLRAERCISSKSVFGAFRFAPVDASLHRPQYDMCLTDDLRGEDHVGAGDPASPLARLRQWLGAHDRIEWPRSFSELEALGVLTPEILEDIHALLDGGAGAERAEEEVIRVLLILVAQGETKGYPPMDADGQARALWQDAVLTLEEIEMDCGAASPGSRSW
jgi:Ca-activated chloride channel family protein